MTFVLGFGALDGLKDILMNLTRDSLNLISQGMLNLLQTPLSFVQSVPLVYTTQNTVVIQGWRTMTFVADLLLGLFLLIGTIQILYGQTTGTLQMPLPQFLARAVLTVLLIHVSAFLGETLLNLNNAISLIVGANAGAFITKLTGGSVIQSTLFGSIMLLVFAIGLFQLVMQGIKRVILFNLLFVLSGPAFVLSFHPYTQSVFSAWARCLVATAFEQSIQFLGLGLGIDFLLATKQTGIFGFVIAIAMLNLTIAIPSLVTQLMGGPSVQLRDNSLVPIVAGAAALAIKVL